MDLVVVEEEDRISKLPDDIIHLILSFLDMKYAVQASTLSKRWNLMWTSMPQLNLDTRMFRSSFKFSKFVKLVLSRRNNKTDVSTLILKELEDEHLFKRILNYAYLHNVKKLTLIKFDCCFNVKVFPQYLFSSHTLKNLTIINRFCFSDRNYIPNSVWDFPALETLNLESIRLGDGNDKSLDIFSKCLNLKDVNLHKCDMEGLEIFNICAPQLVNLTVTEIETYPNVFNVVAPQLKNLTALVDGAQTYPPTMNFLRVSTKGFSYLEKVNLSMSSSYYKREEEVVSRLLSLFNVVRSAKLLILDYKIMECLSSCMDQLPHESVPSPFSNLNYLKMNVSSLLPTKVINHLLAKSPNASFIMELPEVPQKRSRQHVPDDTMCMKVAKLEKTILMKEQVIASQNANIQMKDQIIANQNANIKLKDEVIANQNANIQMKDEVIANQKAMIQMLKSNNIHMHSDVPKPPPVP